MPTRATKFTFGQMRASGVTGVPIYCADYRRTHHVSDRRRALGQ
jgi:hypothetical protein